MTDCKHEPWMHPGSQVVGIESKPWDVSGFLKPPAYVCKHCGVCYVPIEIREAFQRSAEAAGRGEQPTVGSVLAAGLRRRKKEPDA